MSLWNKRRSILKPMLYILYGTSRTGKTTIAHLIGRDTQNFVLLQYAKDAGELKSFIDNGLCVIHDGSRSKIDAEILARRATNIGIECVLVEFKVFA